MANYPKSAELQSRYSELSARKAKFESEKKEVTFKFSDLKPHIDRLKSDIKMEADTIYWLKERILSQKSSIASRNRAVEVSDRLKKSIEGIYGTVNELFAIKNENYADAIQRSIGGRGDFIVVEDDTVADRCINKLKEDKLGNFNFIPLNKIVYANVGQRPNLDFVIDYTINLVSFDDEVSNAMKFVFSDTLLVDSFEKAKSAITKYRMVTIDGTILEKTGVMSGGHREVVNFSEMNKKYRELQKELEEHTALKEKYEAELVENEPTLTYLMSMIKTYEKDITDVNEDLRSIEKELSSFQGSESDITNAIAILESEKFDTEEKLRGLYSAKTEGVDNKKELESLDREINALQVKLGTATSRVETLLKSEYSNLLKRESELEKERQRFYSDMTSTSSKIESGKKELEKITSDLARKSDELVNLRKRRDQLHKETIDLEKSVSKLEEDLNKVQSDSNSLRVKEAELRVKFETAEEELNKHTVKDVVIEDKDTIQTVEKRLSYLSSKVSSFGPINELALETFNKTMQEHTEESEKLAKLNEEKDRILSVIKDIESKKLEAFTRTLNEVNEVFSSVFNSITGGTAELTPDTPDNIFSGGLDIKVDLPNKKVHNVRGLSGGEKSILSIALIISISKYIDVPFYVLDEVDAALDSINSSKFSGLIKAYSERTEFIIISHNEATMLGADVIYGVTMSGDGISKAVSVKMPSEKMKSID
ncbi:MAG: chromosome segregation protein SMC [Candidatus Parvarchaeota archaeon]|nr:chromosome segregation protein SMC [Candidatus Parvarchaeota archaeon]